MSLVHPFESLHGVARSLGMSDLPADPKGVDVFLPFLERMRAEGAVIVLKWDGERDLVKDPCSCTIIVSGQVLAGVYIRSDSESLELGLARVIVEYATRKWGYSA